MIFGFMILKNDEFWETWIQGEKILCGKSVGEQKLHGRVSLCGGCPLQADPFSQKAY